MKKFLMFVPAVLAAAAAIAVAIIGWEGALAQTQPPPVSSQNIVVPQVQSLNQVDCFWDAINGQPAPGWQCATPGMIGGISNYNYSVPLTGFSISPTNTQSYVLINPAGTLATGTLLLPSNPSDGLNLCMMSTQIQTALTVTGATGQTVQGTAVTALTAGTPVCWLFIRSQSTWFRTR